MEEKYLIDTNILIYYLDNKIPESQDEFVSNIFEKSFYISSITKIEILGWYKITDIMRINIDNFLLNATVFYVDKQIENKTIAIKQKLKIDTPDAIIAATALVNKMTIVTRNVDDFKKIRGLKIYNPFKKL